ncbi:hypothetical protein G5714_011268 [Onychostoma macrolepis]|uniref:Uncharacterized protein n=1 Tax=Onychostoma macrolepis TaxID=369639 RepID=A0A7J6CME8_9TELE|nr:hypothetical protein G5714_011268 [Onychostoma macrolepis]
MSHSAGFLTLLSAYAPTLDASPEDKGAFYAHLNTELMRKHEYVARFCACMEGLHFRVDDTPENTWAELRGSMMEAASEVFGLCRRKQPDLFLASSATLLPALADKRATRLSVLQD